MVNILEDIMNNKSNRKVLFVTTLLVVILLIMYMAGFRLSPEAAAKAHAFLEKDSLLVHTEETSLGKVYVYVQDDYYLTIMPEKKFLLWRAPASVTTKGINDKNDLIRTIGSLSVTTDKGAVTVMVINVKDDNVKYIEAGIELQRERQEVKKDKNVVFVWDKPYLYHQVNPIALSGTGEILYKYQIPMNNASIDQKELRWHKAE